MDTDDHDSVAKSVTAVALDNTTSGVQLDSAIVDEPASELRTTLESEREPEWQADARAISPQPDGMISSPSMVDSVDDDTARDNQDDVDSKCIGNYPASSACSASSTASYIQPLLSPVLTSSPRSYEVLSSSTLDGPHKRTADDNGEEFTLAEAYSTLASASTTASLDEERGRTVQVFSSTVGGPDDRTADDNESDIDSTFDENYTSGSASPAASKDDTQGIAIPVSSNLRDDPKIRTAADNDDDEIYTLASASHAASNDEARRGAIPVFSSTGEDQQGPQDTIAVDSELLFVWRYTLSSASTAENMDEERGRALPVPSSTGCEPQNGAAAYIADDNGMPVDGHDYSEASAASNAGSNDFAEGETIPVFPSTGEGPNDTRVDDNRNNIEFTSGTRGRYTFSSASSARKTYEEEEGSIPGFFSTGNDPHSRTAAKSDDQELTFDKNFTLACTSAAVSKDEALGPANSVSSSTGEGTYDRTAGDNEDDIELKSDGHYTLLSVSTAESMDEEEQGATSIFTSTWNDPQNRTEVNRDDGELTFDENYTLASVSTHVTNDVSKDELPEAATTVSSSTGEGPDYRTTGDNEDDIKLAFSGHYTLSASTAENMDEEEEGATKPNYASKGDGPDNGIPADSDENEPRFDHTGTCEASTAGSMDPAQDGTTPMSSTEVGSNDRTAGHDEDDNESTFDGHHTLSSSTSRVASMDLDEARIMPTGSSMAESCSDYRAAGHNESTLNGYRTAAGSMVLERMLILTSAADRPEVRRGAGDNGDDNQSTFDRQEMLSSGSTASSMDVVQAETLFSTTDVPDVGTVGDNNGGPGNEMEFDRLYRSIVAIVDDERRRIIPVSFSTVIEQDNRSSAGENRDCNESRIGEQSALSCAHASTAGSMDLEQGTTILNSSSTVDSPDDRTVGDNVDDDVSRFHSQHTISSSVSIDPEPRGTIPVFTSTENPKDHTAGSSIRDDDYELTFFEHYTESSVGTAASMDEEQGVANPVSSSTVDSADDQTAGDNGDDHESVFDGHYTIKSVSTAGSIEPDTTSELGVLNSSTVLMSSFEPARSHGLLEPQDAIIMVCSSTLDAPDNELVGSDGESDDRSNLGGHYTASSISAPTAANIEPYTTLGLEGLTAFTVLLGSFETQRSDCSWEQEDSNMISSSTGVGHTTTGANSDDERYDLDGRYTASTMTEAAAANVEPYTTMGLSSSTVLMSSFEPQRSDCASEPEDDSNMVSSSNVEHETTGANSDDEGSHLDGHYTASTLSAAAAADIKPYTTLGVDCSRSSTVLMTSFERQRNDCSSEDLNMVSSSTVRDETTGANSDDDGSNLDSQYVASTMSTATAANTEPYSTLGVECLRSSIVLMDSFEPLRSDYSSELEESNMVSSSSVDGRGEQTTGANSDDEGCNLDGHCTASTRSTGTAANIEPYTTLGVECSRSSVILKSSSEPPRSYNLLGIEEPTTTVTLSTVDSPDDQTSGSTSDQGESNLYGDSTAASISAAGGLEPFAELGGGEFQSSFDPERNERLSILDEQSSTHSAPVAASLEPDTTSGIGRFRFPSVLVVNSIEPNNDNRMPEHEAAMQISSSTDNGPDDRTAGDNEKQDDVESKFIGDNTTSSAPNPATTDQYTTVVRRTWFNSTDVKMSSSDDVLRSSGSPSQTRSTARTPLPVSRALGVCGVCPKYPADRLLESMIKDSKSDGDQKAMMARLHRRYVDSTKSKKPQIRAIRLGSRLLKATREFKYAELHSDDTPTWDPSTLITFKKENADSASQSNASYARKLSPQFMIQSRQAASKKSKPVFELDETWNCCTLPQWKHKFKYNQFEYIVDARVRSLSPTAKSVKFKKVKARYRIPSKKYLQHKKDIAQAILQREMHRLQDIKYYDLYSDSAVGAAKSDGLLKPEIPCTGLSESSEGLSQAEGVPSSNEVQSQAEGVLSSYDCESSCT